MRNILFLLLFLLTSLLAGEPEWIELPLSSANGHLWYSTSELEKPADFNEIGRYSAVKLFDGNPATCWAEGVKGAGIGEKIYFDIPAGTSALDITNGLAKNEAIFKKNNRLKKIGLTLYGAVTTDEDAGQFADMYRCLPYDKTLSVNLEDSFKAQQIKLPFDRKALDDFKKNVLSKFEQLDYAKQNKSKRYFKFILSLEILDVYKGSKWDDTCISEISFVRKNGNEVKIDSIYTNDDENTVFFDTNTGKGNVLVQDKQSVFQLVENSADKKWLIIIRMPSDVGDSRAETEYQLWYLPLKKKIDLRAMGYNTGDMYDFSQKNGHTYLNCADNSTMDDLKIDLSKVLSEVNK